MDGAALREALDKARSTEERLHRLISALDNAESTTKSTHGDAAAVVEEMFAAEGKDTAVEEKGRKE